MYRIDFRTVEKTITQNKIIKYTRSKYSVK